MGDVVSRASLNIRFSGGNKKLTKAKSCKVKFDADSEIVLALGIDGGAGFRDKTGGGEMTLEVYPEEGKPEVDYFKLWATRERFSSTLQYGDAGLRFQFRFARVTQPPELGADEQGNAMLNVTIKFLQFGQI